MRTRPPLALPSVRFPLTAPSRALDPPGAKQRCYPGAKYCYTGAQQWPPGAKYCYTGAQQWPPGAK